MSKIYYEKGVLLEFDSLDNLSNGDIFLHGIKITNIGGIVVFAAQNGLTPDVSDEIRKAISDTNSNVINLEDRLRTQNLQPNRPPIRKAIPPEKEAIKYGLMCPYCHQSRVLLARTIPSDSTPTIVVISSISEPVKFLVATYTNWFNCINHKVDGNYELDGTKYMLDFMKNSDEYLETALSDSLILNWIGIMELHSILSEHYNQTTCVLCNNTSDFQAWLNEFSQPTSRYASTCRICGGEMCFTCNSGVFNPNANNQEMRCEKCGYEVMHNFRSK